MKEANLESLADNNNFKKQKHKRERVVFCDDDFYYKVWDPNWEHSKVTRHAFDIGYYDESIACAFDSMLVQTMCEVNIGHYNVSIDTATIDLGYKMKKGKRLYDYNIAGEANDPWKKLIKATDHDQRKDFIKKIFAKSINHRCIVSDLHPANIVIVDEKISLIDYEGLCSFDWFFKGEPCEWEAQNRNLKKCPSPLWRDMSKYLISYLNDCLNFKHQKDINSLERFLELSELVKEL